jgi:hypothetical protein
MIVAILAEPRMHADSPGANDDTGEVLKFERRGVAALRGRTPFAVAPAARPSPVDDIEKYVHRTDDEADDRHRMIANAAATAILLLLILCGVWLADTIAKMRDAQDCVLSGRSNCAPIARPYQPPQP